MFRDGLRSVLNGLGEGFEILEAPEATRELELDLELGRRPS